MQTEPLAFAQYWRNSLADAETSKGAFRLQDCGTFMQLPPETLASGIASAEMVEQCFADKKAQTRFVEIVLRPAVYCAPLQHGVVVANGNPPIITPIVTPALLYRDGRIYPGAQTIIPRDILEPVDAGSFTIGSVANRDEWLTRNPIPGVPEFDENGAPLDDESFYREWQSWLADCHFFLDGVARDWLDSNEYRRANYGYLLKKSMIKASMHILALYDHLQKEQPAAPLFANYARVALAPTEPCLPPNAAFAARLAHASDQYPLAAAQRDALAHLLHSQHGDILAVNGPPGTGKTTLLLSVVASLWAKAALAESEPPVIVAASTNNQAVTNIIDAIGKDFFRGSGVFAGRWLPGIESFGAYFPSRRKEEAAAKKYQTRSFFDKVESAEYFYHAQATYLQAAANAFPAITTVREAVNVLHQALQKEVLKLRDIDDAWVHLSRARTVIKKALGENYQEALNQIRHEYKATETEKERMDTMLDEWENYRAKESLLYAFFSWLPPVAKKTAAPRPSIFKKHMVKHLCRAARAIAGCHRSGNKKPCHAIAATISHTSRAGRPWQKTLAKFAASITGVANSIVAAKAGQACHRMRFTGMRYTCRYPNPFQNIPTVDPLLGRALATGNGSAVAGTGKEKK